MIYRKNIRRCEQIVRIAAGVIVAVIGAIAMPGDVIGYLAIAIGGFVALTGVFGFCPAYAMTGRKLD